MDVVDQGSAGVAVISDMQLPTAKPPDQKCINRPEQDLTALGALPEPRVLIEQILDLGSGKVRIQDKARSFPKHRSQAVCFKLLANASRHATLPDNRMAYRLACVPIPQQCRFTLVRDSNGRNLCCGYRSLGERFSRNRQLG